jgi:hypothetical protein
MVWQCQSSLPLGFFRWKSDCVNEITIYVLQFDVLQQVFVNAKVNSKQTYLNGEKHQHFSSLSTQSYQTQGLQLLLKGTGLLLGPTIIQMVFHCFC